ncbi:MAG: hypothetical protein LBT89_09075 [Planctomycetaceae bacterium]|jgi:CheY-like chemotaxis protein|nr:hypothetical protein [Planctomycetaceae bacterium]
MEQVQYLGWEFTVIFAAATAEITLLTLWLWKNHCAYRSIGGVWLFFYFFVLAVFFGYNEISHFHKTETATVLHILLLPSFIFAIIAVAVWSDRWQKKYNLISSLLQKTNIVLSEEKNHSERVTALKDAAFANACNEIRESMYSLLYSIDQIGLKVQHQIPADESQYVYETLTRISDYADNIFLEISDVIAFAQPRTEGIHKRRLQRFSPENTLKDLTASVPKKLQDKAVSVQLQQSGSVPAQVIGELPAIRQAVLSLLNFLLRSKTSGGIFIEYGIALEKMDYGEGIFNESSGKIRTAALDAAGSAVHSSYANQTAGSKTELIYPSSVNTSLVHKRKLVLTFCETSGNVTASDSDKFSLYQPQSLSVVRLLAELANGRVELRHLPNMPTSIVLSFDVWLEKEDQHGLSPAQKRVDRLDSSVAEYVHHLEIHVLQKRMLIVGLTDGGYEHFALLMNALGTSICFAQNEKSAVETVRADDIAGQPFDFVVIDMQSFGSNGSKIVRALRNSGFHQTIIAITTRTTIMSREWILASGCNACVEQPIDIEQFLSVLASVSKTQ